MLFTIEKYCNLVGGIFFQIHSKNKTRSEKCIISLLASLVLVKSVTDLKRVSTINTTFYICFFANLWWIVMQIVGPSTLWLFKWTLLAISTWLIVNLTLCYSIYSMSNIRNSCYFTAVTSFQWEEHHLITQWTVLKVRMICKFMIYLFSGWFISLSLWTRGECLYIKF